jgi:hypothetical protein
MNQPVKCKFCGSGVSLEIDDDALKLFRLDFWLKLAACNRCADFEERKHRLLDKAESQAIKFARLKTAKQPADKIEAVLSDLKKTISVWLFNAGRYYNQSTSEPPFLVEGIAEQPDKVRTILLIELGKIRRAAHPKLL